ncbi:hypothetical protein Y032_0061g3221 [Ancylostoma ceylanicum]|uniref:Mos1 transposase HTH domain-containing protein n=1 Tax=Ancylostoma ceylanicum TaxID=53326 RepID=A0A016U3N3_9BILA|nr:hypothetical protein Y032_0061g3221 [Ancylostoma ceylanicum]
MLSEAQLRTILLHEFKLGRKAVKAHENIVKVWGPDVTSPRHSQLWFRKYRSGGKSLEDEPGRGRIYGLDDDVLMSIVEAYPRKTVLEIAEALTCYFPPSSSVWKNMER